MTRAVFMVFFLGHACAAVQGHEQKYAQGPEEASMLQTLLGQKLRNVEKVVDHITSGVSSRKQKTQEDTSAGDWYVCDQCDATNKEIDPDNHFCFPGTADYCDAVPCDAGNRQVARPGWWCRPGTATVIVSTAERNLAKTSSIIHVNQPRSQQKKFAAMLAIPPARTWECVPCDPNNEKVVGKWCYPRTADECSHACDPCDPSNSDVNKKGWFCKRGTADVCVDQFGWTVLNYAAMKFDANGTIIEGVIPGTAIPTQSCINNPWCLWGIVAGAIVAVVVTGGAALYFAPASLGVAGACAKVGTQFMTYAPQVGSFSAGLSGSVASTGSVGAMGTSAGLVPLIMPAFAGIIAGGGTGLAIALQNP